MSSQQYADAMLIHWRARKASIQVQIDAGKSLDEATKHADRIFLIDVRGLTEKFEGMRYE